MKNMKNILTLLFSLICVIGYGQGIEPSSLQPSPHKSGVLKATQPYTDPFTGQTVYLYTHEDSITSGSGGAGTVTSVGVAAGTSGTDINITGSPITSAGTINVNIPTASATNRGALSSTDWSTFNNKVGGSGTATRVAFWSSSTGLTSDAGLDWDNTNKRLIIASIPYASYATGQVAIGNSAGVGATGASSSNFFGSYAGYGAYSTSSSNFFGNQSGREAIGASNSNFFGQQSGALATSASNSNFFGYQSGRDATGASISNFFGYQSGRDATGASNSNFFGQQSGYGATSASNSNFFGNQSGKGAIGAAYCNLLGFKAGMTASSNNIGQHNTIIGSNISLPNAAVRMLNIGGVLFGTGLNNIISGDPIITPISGGKIGIMKVIPATTLDVDGDFQVSVRTGSATKLSGFDANGKIMDVNVGSGLSLTAGTLTNINGYVKDSTDVTQGHGIIVTESPLQTFNIKADTFKLATIYDLTLKQDTLISGVTIKTVQGESLLGSGNVQIDGSETKVIAGTNTSVTGTGTTASPYVISSVGGGSGTVTSVGLGIGTSGTNISVSGSPVTTAGTFTLNIPTASATNRGALSNTDWTTFNNKIGGAGTVTQLAFFNSSSTIMSDSKLFFDNVNKRLGIGTSSPTTDLDVNGTLRVRNSTGTATTLLGRDGNGNLSTVAISPIFSISGGQLNYNRQTWAEIGSNLASWGSTGALNSGKFIGIGTLSPARVLDVNGYVRIAGSVGTPTTIMGRNSSGDVSAISVGSGLSLSGGILSSTGGGLSGSGVATRIAFWSSTTSLTSDANLYWNNSTSRLGIGTSSPLQTLHVNGNARITGSTGTPTTIMGRNSSGDVGNVTIGTGLSLSGGILSATSAGAQSLSYGFKVSRDIPLDITAPGVGVKFREGKGIYLDRTASNVMTVIKKDAFANMVTTGNKVNTSLGSTEVKIPFDDYRTDNCSTPKIAFNNANDRLTVATGQAGVYRVAFSCDVYNQSLNNYEIEIYMKINGSFVDPHSSITKKVISGSTLDIDHHFSRNFFTYIGDNDYVELFYKRSSGTGTAITIKNAIFSLEYVNEDFCTPQ